jgi:broad specificity phosphatase PhoE
MAKIYLIRHGEAAARWDEELDPSLSPKGVRQAKAVARTLEPLGPLNMITSPLARARETSAPLAEFWQKTPRVEARVGEIPPPPEVLGNRMKWLERVIREKWPCLGPALQDWRQGVIDALCSLDRDTVVFSHFVSINVAVGAATRDDRVLCFWPDNTSVTIVQTNGSHLSLVERGAERTTQIR